jgi:hypothetical protein
MILWTATLVVAVGLVGALTMLRPPPGYSPASADESLVTKQPLVVVTPTGRDPASVNTAVQLSPISLGGKENLQAVDLTIPCDGVQKTIFTQRVKQLRLKGNSCLSNEKKLKRSDIQNAANGYSATVFFPTHTTFTTDYISLENGLNRIVIKHQYANGNVEEREYVVEREL